MSERMRETKTLRALFLQAVKEVGNDIGFSAAHRVWKNDLKKSSQYVIFDDVEAFLAVNDTEICPESIGKGEIWDCWADEAINVVVSALRETVQWEIQRKRARDARGIPSGSESAAENETGNDA